MLVELRKLNIINEGYKTKISLDRIYINSDNILSISDYEGVRQFLLREGSEQYMDRSFSLIKMGRGNQVEEIIALGSAEDIYRNFSLEEKRKLLKD